MACIVGYARKQLQWFGADQYSKKNKRLNTMATSLDEPLGSDDDRTRYDTLAEQDEAMSEEEIEELSYYRNELLTSARQLLTTFEIEALQVYLEYPPSSGWTQLERAQKINRNLSNYLRDLQSARWKLCALANEPWVGRPGLRSPSWVTITNQPDSIPDQLWDRLTPSEKMVLAFYCREGTHVRSHAECAQQLGISYANLKSLGIYIHRKAKILGFTKFDDIWRGSSAPEQPDGIPDQLWDRLTPSEKMVLAFYSRKNTRSLSHTECAQQLEISYMNLHQVGLRIRRKAKTLGFTAFDDVWRGY